jgi:hypothetical protein
MTHGIANAIAILARATLETLASIALLVALFVIAILFVLTRIIKLLAPFLVRAACVVFALWSIAILARDALALYAAHQISPGALATFSFVGAIVFVGVWLADAMGANDKNIWGVMLFCGILALIFNQTIHAIDARALALFPVALAFAVNPFWFFIRGDEMESRNEGALKKIAVALAALTYAGAVIYGDIQFLQVMDKAFPGDGIMRALAMAGAVMTAISAVTLPVALHWWFSPGLQFLWGIAFWVLDILALGLNAMLAYQVASGHLDAMLATWQMFSPATPLLAVIGWGIAFLLDPSQQERHAVAEMQADQIETYATQMRQAAKSDAVYQEILQAAQLHAREFAQSLHGHRDASRNRAERASRDNDGTSDKVRGNGHLQKAYAMDADAATREAKPSRNGRGRDNGTNNGTSHDPNA